MVALLVLMSLIGTAYISATRSERYASQQTERTTRLDLIVEGALNLAREAIRDDLCGELAGARAEVVPGHPLALGGDAHRPDSSTLDSRTWCACASLRARPARFISGTR